MAEVWRLFIAIELPQAVRQAIVAVRDNLQNQLPSRALRWVRPDGIHLTLKFLGDVPLTHIDSIKQAMATALERHLALSLYVSGLGCFPNTRKPRVLWLGLGGDLHFLSELRDDIEKHIAPLGYPTEDRPFNPHLTLARVGRNARREDIERIGQLVERHDVKHIVNWPVHDVTLVRSELRPDGAVYTQLHQVELQVTHG